MPLSKTERRSTDTVIKFFDCGKCGHEMRLMVWCDEDAPDLPAAAGVERKQ
jgi:hypothetical protein